MNVLTHYLAERFPEVDAMAFYSDVFSPSGLATRAERRGRAAGTYSPIAVRVMPDGNGGERAERQALTQGLAEVGIIEALSVMDKADILSPVTYAGRRPLMDMAHELFAIVFDLDGVRLNEAGEPVGLADLLYQSAPTEADPGLVIPRPTYIASSGTGLHLYYLLDEPIRLWPNVLERLNAFRTALTKRIWNKYVTDLSREVQLEAVTQGFRMVGSRAKDGKQVVRAFRTGERASIAELNRFVPEESRVPDEVLHARHTLDEARRLWPEWDPQWRKRASEAPRCPWRVKRDLFDWWCRRVEGGEATVGHRYWCVWVAAALAAKCPDVTYEELESWAVRVVPMLDHISTDDTNRFTPDDAMAALAAYGNPRSLTLRRDKIAEKSGMVMPVTKRNRRELQQHIRMVNATRKMRRDVFGEDEYRNGGRPKGSPNKAHPKRDAVLAYREAHPEATQREIAAALGFSLTTVNKWLKGAQE